MSKDVAATVRLLADTELFAGLESGELEQLASYTTPFALAAGEVLFNRGERTDSVFLIDVGRLEVVTRGPDGWISVGEVGRGEIAGEMALLTGEPRSATLRAIEPTSGIAIGRDVIDALRRSHRHGNVVISRHLAELACRRIRRRLALFSGRSIDEGPQSTAIIDGEPCEPDDVRLLASLPWFAALNDALPDILALGRWTRVPRAAVLVEPGAEPQGIFVPSRGALEELLDVGDLRYRVRLVGPGRAAASLGVVDDGPSPTTVRALERAMVFELPRKIVTDLLDGSGKTTRALLSAVTQDLAGAVGAANAPHPWERRS